MSSPEQIQQEIERTRESLSAGVDRLSEKVSPGKAVGRRVDSIKSRTRSMKEIVMGVSDSAAHGLSDATESVNSAAFSAGSAAASAAASTKDALGSAASHAGDVVSSAPSQARLQTQGNPVAAGVIAFGIGWLVSSLLPPSQREQELARKAQGKAQDKLSEPVKEAAQEIAGNLQQPLQEAVEHVKAAATDAAQSTVEQARSSVDEVATPLHEVPAAAQGASGQAGPPPGW